MTKHVPVLLNAVLENLGNIDGARILDATFGAGGYTRAFLSAGASVVAFDRDPGVVADATKIANEFREKFQFIPKTFSHMAELQEQFDAIVFDLGISSMQIDNPERGFSFRFDAPLDMRMSNSGDTVLDMFDKLGVSDIAKILRDFGDVRVATSVAKAIKEKMPRTTFELRDLIHNPRDIAPVFQALRIAVNDEMGEITRALATVPDLLKVGGRCLCVTFHSIEDRIVKNTFREWASVPGDPHIPLSVQARFTLLSPRTPTAAEVNANPRARSAHLRGVVKSY